MNESGTTHEILLERESDWLTIRLNRPEARNALSTTMIEALIDAMQGARENRGIRGITIRGNDGVFCAGGDLKGFRSIIEGETQDEDAIAAANRRAGDLFELIESMPQIVVMLVEGAAIAGGLGMLCAADSVVVTRDAKFSLTETTLGIPPAQIAPFVARRIGQAAARHVMLTAARFDGQVAFNYGLANVVVNDAAGLDAEEETIRQQVRRCAPGANAATKAILLAAATLEGEAMKRYAGEHFARCMLSEEGREGIAAFIEKRKPRWAD
jgi:isohexenylglutaconyl-CoA hydratase